MAENDGGWSSVGEIDEKRSRTRDRVQNGAESLRLLATDADQISQKWSTSGTIRGKQTSKRRFRIKNQHTALTHNFAWFAPTSRRTVQ
jgi:hypothetical protein